MPTKDEKAAFSRRLELALRRSAEPVTGATELALRFNLRHHGSAVSPQTAHKWLSGRAIPTNDKLATLADWLNVNAHWLHYGPPSVVPPHAGEQSAPYEVQTPAKPRPDKAAARTSAKPALAPAPAPDALALALRIQSLAPHRRYLVEELVTQLLADGS